MSGSQSGYQTSITSQASDEAALEQLVNSLESHLNYLKIEEYETLINQLRALSQKLGSDKSEIAKPILEKLRYYDEIKNADRALKNSIQVHPNEPNHRDIVAARFALQEKLIDAKKYFSTQLDLMSKNKGTDKLTQLNIDVALIEDLLRKNEPQIVTKSKSEQQGSKQSRLSMLAEETKKVFGTTKREGLKSGLKEAKEKLQEFNPFKRK